MRNSLQCLVDISDGCYDVSLLDKNWSIRSLTGIPDSSRSDIDTVSLFIFHELFEPERSFELVVHLRMVSLPDIVGVSVQSVVELHGMETTLVDVEVNVAPVEVWRDGFPYYCVRI